MIAPVTLSRNKREGKYRNRAQMLSIKNGHPYRIRRQHCRGFTSHQLQQAVIGNSEGETCNRDGCEGVIDFTSVDNCSCHLSAPCSEHMDSRPHCPECSWDIADEPNNYLP